MADQLLADARVQVNAADPTGLTPLHIAALGASAALVTRLVARGELPPPPAVVTSQGLGS